MKYASPVLVHATVVVLAALSLAPESQAQMAARVPPAGAPAAVLAANAVRIRKMPKVGRSLLVRTPEYQSNATRATRKPREWAFFAVDYDTQPEWLDELTISYTVMAEGLNEERKREYSVYQTTVRHGDVARGEHSAAVVLPPQAVERFGSVVAFAVEISVGGKVVASDQVVGIPNLPPDWWKNRDVLESSSVIRRDGYLVDRSKSPFGLANIDDYEAVK